MGDTGSAGFGAVSGLLLSNHSKRLLILQQQAEARAEAAERHEREQHAEEQRMRLEAQARERYAAANVTVNPLDDPSVWARTAQDVFTEHITLADADDRREEWRRVREGEVPAVVDDASDVNTREVELALQDRRQRRKDREYLANTTPAQQAADQEAARKRRRRWHFAKG